MCGISLIRTLITAPIDILPVFYCFQETRFRLGGSLCCPKGGFQMTVEKAIAHLPVFDSSVNLA